MFSVSNLDGPSQPYVGPVYKGDLRQVHGPRSIFSDFAQESRYSSLVQEVRKHTFKKRFESSSKGVIAQDIMTHPVFSLSLFASLQEVYELFVTKGFCYVPILKESQQVVGMLHRQHFFQTLKSLFPSYEDLAKQTEPMKSFTQALSIEKMMDQPVISCLLKTPLEQLIVIFEKEQLGAMIVEENKQLKGLITRGDILRSLSYMRHLDLHI